MVPGGDITVVDVAARDGIQNEATPVGTASKIQLLRRLEAAGVRSYEAASFVHPRWVPQMADAEQVIQGLPSNPGVTRLALVVNERGYRRAVEAGVRHVRLVVAATDSMNSRNANATSGETMQIYAPILAEAQREGIHITGVIGVAFGCPFEGAVDPGRVLDLASAFAAGGAGEIDFADTVGMAVPSQVQRLVQRAAEAFPGVRLGVHLHNTRNLGLANAYAALDAGAEVIDASLGGAGGCPFAPKATGNIPTEDLVFMLEGMGVRTGIDLDRLIEAAQWFESVLQRPLPGMVMKAGGCWREPPPLA